MFVETVAVFVAEGGCRIYLLQMVLLLRKFADYVAADGCRSRVAGHGLLQICHAFLCCVSLLQIGLPKCCAAEGCRRCLLHCVLPADAAAKGLQEKFV